MRPKDFYNPRWLSLEQGEGCLSRGVLDITCEKSHCFLYLPNQYKDIQPLNSVAALPQKFFILPQFIAVSFNATEQGPPLRSCLLLFHELGYSLNVILSPHQRQPSMETREWQCDLFTPELFKPFLNILYSKCGLALNLCIGLPQVWLILTAYLFVCFLVQLLCNHL